MRQKVQRFFEINHKENIYYWIDSNHLLDQLPANLRTSLLLFSYYAMIKNISILQYDANFTAAIIVHFKLIKLKKKELVYREDDPPEESNSLLFSNSSLLYIKRLSKNGQ